VEIFSEIVFIFKWIDHDGSSPRIENLYHHSLEESEHSLEDAYMCPEWNRRSFFC
jgi:hypothetical protein